MLTILGVVIVVVGVLGVLDLIALGLPASIVVIAGGFLLILLGGPWLRR